MSKAISRRDFMKVTGAVGAAGLLAACGGNGGACPVGNRDQPLPATLAAQDQERPVDRQRGDDAAHCLRCRITGQHPGADTAMMRRMVSSARLAPETMMRSGTKPIRRSWLPIALAPILPCSFRKRSASLVLPSGNTALP